MNVSLKTRMALAVSAVFVLAIGLLVVLPLLYFTSEFKKSIGRQQFSLVTSLADNIDDKLRIAERSLVAAAGQLPPEAASDPDAAQRFLDSRSSLFTVFDNALFLFSQDGRIIAESPYREGRRGRDISFRDYYQKTIASGKPHISSPYISTHNPGHPAIIITAPIFDAQNKLVAILAGSFDLLGENFLQELSRVKIGKTGYLYLYDDDRTMIVHPDKSRIMQRDVPLGANKLFDAAIKGFEGSGQTVNSRGLHVIASFKHLNTTNWIVGANYPEEEAYAPIRKIVDYILPAIFLGTAAMLILVWLLMDRMTAPLLAITAHVESLPVLDPAQKLITLPIGGEIGKLAEAFNGMVTDLDLQQEALRESELNFRALADNANDGMLIITGQAGLTYGNRRAAEILSYDNAELLNISVIDLVFPDERYKVVERYAAVAAGERVPKQFEINLMSREGRRVPTEVTTARTVWRKEQAELVIVRDISERKQAEEDIQQLAYYDTLTGLPNRTLLHDRLRQMIAHAGRNGHTLGVMFLDLDRFKSINDSLGHLTGDLLLKGVGARLASAVREADTVARLGGDEFVVVVSAVAHEEHLAKVADKIIALFDEPIVVEGQEIFTTCSIGIATFPNDGADASSLLKNADIAMYQAKEQGRNNYQFFSQEMNVKALEQMMLETSLRRALERQEFFLAYQPQVELPSGRVIGTEALLRWRHPELGVVAPMRFIPLAEETGLIIPIGEWVLRTACAGNKKWLDRGARLRVAVNLSARQLNQPGFVALVADILRETGLPPEALELEVTESMIMTKNSSTMTVLTKLKEMGVGLAIDDFGTGYSSLSYLKHFPIDRIKIDRSFVRDIPANSDDTAISEAIIAMAHSLNLKVTAEGVEHQEQLHFLASRLCDEIQGFYFMPPVSAEEVEEVIFGGAPLRHAESI